MKKILKVMLVLMIFLVLPVQAKEIEHFTAKVDNDIELKDTYHASVVAIGDSVEFNSKVQGITVGAANNLTYNGNSDYVVLAGNAANIKGIINSDAFVFGNIVTFDDKAKVNRDATIAALDVNVKGAFERDIVIYGSKVVLSNVSVKGNVKIYAGQIEIQKGAIINGTLAYPEDSQIVQNKKAQIGKVKKMEALQKESDDNFFATVAAQFWAFLSMALIYAVISLFFPKVLTKINNKFDKASMGDFAEVFTKGLIALILVPVIIFLLIWTMIGMPLGIILAIFYGMAIYLSTIFAAYLLGYKIWQKVFEKDIHVLLLGFLGLFIILILNLIPGVRILVSIITLLIGLGLIIDVIRPIKE